MGIETEGGFLITQIKQIQARLFEKLLADAGVAAFSGAQGRVLYVLWQQDGIPIKELSRKTGLTKASLTSMLSGMENANLVTRTPDEADKRKICVSLTDNARKLSEEYNKVSAKMNQIFYAGFSNDEIITFDNTLRRILSNLTEKENLL